MTDGFQRWLLLVVVFLSTIPGLSSPAECDECPPQTVEAPAEHTPSPVDAGKPCRTRCACPCGPVFLLPPFGSDLVREVSPVSALKSAPQSFCRDPHPSDFVDLIFYPPRLPESV